MINYLSHISNGGDDTLQKLVGYRYFCPKCNRHANPMCILNVSTLPSINEGHDWVCDQCIIEWKREKKKIDPTDDFVVPQEWEVKFLEKIGAPQKQILSAKRYALKHIKIKYNEIVNHNLWSQEDKLKIEERYTNPASISKKRIRANNKEDSLINNIPENSTIYIDGEKVGHGNSEITLSAPVKGKYKIKIESPYHLNCEEEIDAY